MTSEAWRIRDAVPADLPFVTQTYVREGARSLLPSERHRLSEWPALAERMIATMVERGTIAVACSPSDSNAILGYGMAETGADRAELHWLYVKGLYRRQWGIGRSLLEHLTSHASRVYVTHTTARWQRDKVRAWDADRWRLGRRTHPIKRWPQAEESAA